jgi:AICAR transformylase/IMP cyclohydrolase PurH
LQFQYTHMSQTKNIKTALISVFHKDGLEDLLSKLNKEGVKFLSTGGTQKFIEHLGYDCQKVEDITTYPSILGGRVKTLHPKIFGGILGRRDLPEDKEEMIKYSISPIDLVIVDLYPFEETVKSGASETDIIEKIDIGGISLIRAAAKNFKDVVIIPSKNEYMTLLDILNKKGAQTDIEERKYFAERAFATSSHYDTIIHSYFK